ncbi:MAG: hypothetical protein P8008_01035 [Gammaproteobacteria bacterium]
MSLFSELKRRNVIRVGIAYLVGSWLLLQVTDVLVSLLELPASMGKIMVAILALGFLPAMAFSWAYELTPEGLKRDSEVDRSASIAPRTGRRLNLLIIVMLVMVAGYFFWESRFKPADEVAVAAPEAPAVETVEPLPADDVSIAVLPFTNMSTDADNEYFADGLSEEILNRLAQLAELRVIARTSSFAFKGQNQDLREIGRILGTANILEGSVRRQGDRVRVTAQLIETRSGTHLWSETFDRRLDDIFQIQDEIAQEVAEALNIVLDEKARQAMLAIGVRNVDAFVAYQRGYELYIDAHAETGRDELMSVLEEGNEWFDRALAAEPAFSDALLRKTDLYAHHVLETDEPVAVQAEALDTMLDLLDQALEAARDEDRRRAIEIDRTFFTDDWSRLPKLLAEAVASESCAEGNWMELTVPFLDPEVLLSYYRKQVRCDPLMLLNYAFLAQIEAHQGDLEEARATLARGRSIGGDHYWLRATSWRLQMASGEAEDVLRNLEVELEATPDDPWLQRWRIMMMAITGRVEPARRAVEEMVRAGRLDLSNQVRLHAVTGNRAAANAAAAALDALPGGPVELIRGLNVCECGAPFDLDATPRLAARLDAAGFAWPPRALLSYPAKEW